MFGTGAGPGPAGAGREQPAADATLTGFTTPYRTATLAAVRTGRIVDLPVHEGDLVGAGDLCLRLDDAVQRQRVLLAQAAAESTLEIDLARVRHEAAQRDLKHVQQLSQGSASAKELSDAQASAEAATLELALAEFHHTQAEREYAYQQAVLAEHQVVAPFAGYVAQRVREVGDTIEEREAVVMLVQLDPLVVSVDCPLADAAGLMPGRRVRVSPAEGAGADRTGEVVFVSRVADAASQTVKVKIHVPNAAADWIAGAHVNVDLQAPPASAAEAQPGQ